MNINKFLKKKDTLSSQQSQNCPKRQSTHDKLEILTLLDKCSQILKDDRLYLRNLIKDGNSELQSILLKYKKATDLHALQTELRKYLHKLKGKTPSSGNLILYGMTSGRTEQESAKNLRSPLQQNLNIYNQNQNDSLYANAGKRTVRANQNDSKSHSLSVSPGTRFINGAPFNAGKPYETLQPPHSHSDKKSPQSSCQNLRPIGQSIDSHQGIQRSSSQQPINNNIYSLPKSLVPENHQKLNPQNRVEDTFQYNHNSQNDSKQHEQISASLNSPNFTQLRKIPMDPKFQGNNHFAASQNPERTQAKYHNPFFSKSKRNDDEAYIEQADEKDADNEEYDQQGDENRHTQQNVVQEEDEGEAQDGDEEEGEFRGQHPGQSIRQHFNPNLFENQNRYEPNNLRGLSNLQIFGQNKKDDHNQEYDENDECQRQDERGQQELEENEGVQNNEQEDEEEEMNYIQKNPEQTHNLPHHVTKPDDRKHQDQEQRHIAHNIGKADVVSSDDQELNSQHHRQSNRLDFNQFDQRREGENESLATDRETHQQPSSQKPREIDENQQNHLNEEQYHSCNGEQDERYPEEVENNEEQKNGMEQNYEFQERNEDVNEDNYEPNDQDEEYVQATNFKNKVGDDINRLDDFNHKFTNSISHQISGGGFGSNRSSQNRPGLDLPFKRDIQPEIDNTVPGARFDFHLGPKLEHQTIEASAKKSNKEMEHNSSGSGSIASRRGQNVGMIEGFADIKQFQIPSAVFSGVSRDQYKTPLDHPIHFGKKIQGSPHQTKYNELLGMPYYEQKQQPQSINSVDCVTPLDHPIKFGQKIQGSPRKDQFQYPTPSSSSTQSNKGIFELNQQAGYSSDDCITPLEKHIHVPKTLQDSPIKNQIIQCAEECLESDRKERIYNPSASQNSGEEYLLEGKQIESIVAGDLQNRYHMQEGSSSSRFYDQDQPEEVLLRYNVEEIYGNRHNNNNNNINNNEHNNYGNNHGPFDQYNAYDTVNNFQKTGQFLINTKSNQEDYAAPQSNTTTATIASYDDQFTPTDLLEKIQSWQKDIQEHKNCPTTSTVTTGVPTKTTENFNFTLNPKINTNNTNNFSTLNNDFELFPKRTTNTTTQNSIPQSNTSSNVPGVPFSVMNLLNTATPKLSSGISAAGKSNQLFENNNIFDYQTSSSSANLLAPFGGGIGVSSSTQGFNLLPVTPNNIMSPIRPINGDTSATNFLSPNLLHTNNNNGILSNNNNNNTRFLSPNNNSSVPYRLQQAVDDKKQEVERIYSHLFTDWSHLHNNNQPQGLTPMALQSHKISNECQPSNSLQKPSINLEFYPFTNIPENGYQNPLPASEGLKPYLSATKTEYTKNLQPSSTTNPNNLNSNYSNTNNFFNSQRLSSDLGLIQKPLFTNENEYDLDDVPADDSISGNGARGDYKQYDLQSDKIQNLGNIPHSSVNSSIAGPISGGIGVGRETSGNNMSAVERPHHHRNFSHSYFESQLPGRDAADNSRPTSGNGFVASSTSTPLVNVNFKAEIDPIIVQDVTNRLLLHTITAQDLFDEVFTDASLSKISQAFFRFKIETIINEISNNKVELNNQDIDYFFELCDTKKDGFLEVNELGPSLRAFCQQKTNIDPKTKQVFDHFNIQQMGYVTRLEIQNKLRDFDDLNDQSTNAETLTKQLFDQIDNLRKGYLTFWDFYLCQNTYQFKRIQAYMKL